jgi:diguanylate cyclase (GGDEF)-like protein
MLPLVRMAVVWARARRLNWRGLAEPAVWLLIALLLMAALTIEFRDWNFRSAIHEATVAAAPTATSDAMWLESEIEKQRLVPYILANDPDVVAALSPAPGGGASLALARDALNRKLAMLCDGTTAGVIFVLDASGVSVAASNWDTAESFVGVDYSFRPYYKEVRHGQGAEYFASGLVSRLPGLFISHAVMMGGRFIGVVVVKVQFDRLEAFWSQLGAEVMVTEPHGIADITDVPAWRFHTLAPLPPAERDALRHTGQYGDAKLTALPFTAMSDGAVKVGDADDVSVKAAIPTTDWTLYLMVPVTRALATAKAMADGVALLITSLLMGAGLAVRSWLRTYMAESARNEEIRQQAVTDPLTQLPNRRAFEVSLAQQWSQCWRRRTALSALMIDVDHFKPYNDFYGHQAGDACLRAIAQVLRPSATRQGDLVARYGGEEFVVLLPDTDMAGAHTVAEVLRSRLRALNIPHATSPNGGVVTVSVGVAALVPAAEDDAAALISAADKALYEAKNAGRDQVVLAC